MEVIQDNLWLCDDCLFAAVNDDYSGLDYWYTDEQKRDAKEKAIRQGLEELGAYLVPDFDSESGEGINEFDSWHGCDCCGTQLDGQRHRFAILGEEKQ